MFLEYPILNFGHTKCKINEKNCLHLLKSMLEYTYIK